MACACADECDGTSHICNGQNVCAEAQAPGAGCNATGQLPQCCTLCICLLRPQAVPQMLQLLLCTQGCGLGHPWFRVYDLRVWDLMGPGHPWLMIKYTSLSVFDEA